MGQIVDRAGPETSLGTAALGVVAKAKAAMEANRMGNAVEIQTPAQMATAQSRAVMTPMEMLDRAVMNNASVETLAQLMNLQERWEANQARKAFDEAMAAVKANLPAIKKTRKVDFTSNKGRTNYQYEDLASIMAQIGPVLSQHGLSVRYRTSAEPNQPISVTCIISHKLGHSEENTLMAGRDDSGNKNSIQAIGSTVTYLQRYTLKAALGLAAAADDDGAKADDEPAQAIDANQFGLLDQLIEEADLDKAAFCEHWHIDSVKEMPAAKFNDAVASLRRRIAYRAQQTAGRAANA